MKKCLFSYRNNDISCTHYRGHATLREIFENMCNLMRLGEYFDQILYKNCFFKGISFYRTMLHKESYMSLQLQNMLMGFQCISPMNTHEV